jgi:DNA-binding response OmpR family regulator
MHRILVVDDEDYVRQYYIEELSDEGYQVATVPSGCCLPDVIDLFQPHVLVMDIKLQKYDGLNLLKYIRRRCYDMQVILCSACDTYIDDQSSVNADYYVIKSSDLSELKEKIKESIAIRSIMPFTEAEEVMASNDM